MSDSWFARPAALPCARHRAAAGARQAELTKPPGALGHLEQLAIDLAALQHRAEPAAEKIAIAVFAADHGVACDGVSAFPQSVTAQMVENFRTGGAAISVLARQLGASMQIVNAGTLTQTFPPPVINAAIAPGTANLAVKAAMSADQALESLALGRRVFKQLPAADIVIGGDMGIGNTTAAAAVSAALTGLDAAALTGPGSGLDARGVDRKRQLIEQALTRARRAGAGAGQPLTALAELGGFEIGALAGFYLAAAQAGRAALVDGFITSSAALLACALNPGCRDWLIFSHHSAEPGHTQLLKHLNAQPLLSLQMRLGEGSGAAVAVAVLRSACALHNDMATFSSAGVSGKST